MKCRQGWLFGWVLSAGVGLSLLPSQVNAAAASAEPQMRIPQSGVLNNSVRKDTKIRVAPATTVKRSLCVWDIMGHTGEVVAMMRDYQVYASQLGVDFEIRSYVDERIASEDFRTKYCDAVLLTGLRARAFNSFTGSIEAVGAIPTDAHMRTLVQVLSSPRSQSLMLSREGDRSFEIAGILPFGSAHGFVSDRDIKGADQLPGKTIAVFDYDKAQAQLVRELGALPDPSDVNNFASKFNAKSVDIVIAPLAAYQALELYRGLGQKGGIIDYVLAQVSLQVIIDPDRFPAGFGQQSRQYMNQTLYPRAVSMLERYASFVDDKYWIKSTPPNLKRYDEMSRISRIGLIEQGIYNPKMMSLLKRIRCQHEPARSECSMQSE